jgi:hypothetical protein
LPERDGTHLAALADGFTTSLATAFLLNEDRRDLGTLVTPDKFLDAHQVQALRRSKGTGRDSGDRYAARNTPVVDTHLGAPPTFP